MDIGAKDKTIFFLFYDNSIEFQILDKKGSTRFQAVHKSN